MCVYPCKVVQCMGGVGRFYHILFLANKFFLLGLQVQGVACYHPGGVLPPITFSATPGVPPLLPLSCKED